MREKRMIRILAVLLGVCMLGSTLSAGCGADQGPADTETAAQGDGETTDDDAPDKNAAGENNGGGDEDRETGSGYVFESNGVEIAVDMEMSPIADALGEPDSYYEQPSCAAEGIAKIYTYPGFQIQTYPDGERDLIACIILKDDSVSTPEGIDLSMTKDDIISVYGTEYEETDTAMIYEQGGGKLCFIMDGYDIASIEYDSPVLN